MAIATITIETDNGTEINVNVYPGRYMEIMQDNDTIEFAEDDIVPLIEALAKLYNMG